MEEKALVFSLYITLKQLSIRSEVVLTSTL